MGNEGSNYAIRDAIGKLSCGLFVVMHLNSPAWDFGAVLAWFEQPKNCRINL
jgi:hypothetical protein